MSFILDALHKTERDKDIKNKPIPDLNTTHTVQSQPSELDLLRQSPKLLIGIIFVLFALAVVLVVVLMLRKGQPTELSPISVPVTIAHSDHSAHSDKLTTSVIHASDTPSEAVVDADPVSVKDSLTAKRPVEISETEIDPEIQALYDAPADIEPSAVAQQQRLDSTRRRTSDTSKVSEAPQSGDHAFAQALWDASAIRPDTPIPEHLRSSMSAENLTITPSPKSEVVEEADLDAPFEETMAAFDTTPFLHELSENTQISIPTLMYSEHQYINGYVVFNRQTLQAGERVEGVKVERILADGVVLSFEGRSFKMAALSSWVNY